MSKCVRRVGVPAFIAAFSLVVALAVVAAFPLYGTNQRFSVPDELPLRIRLDDTLTSVDSQIDDPFSATVVDKGDYQNARVYGHFAQIDISGRIKDRRACSCDSTV